MAQQERAIRTKLAIVTAAASVFDECGYERATIGEILARAGVTKGALYFHFPSKAALAEGVLSQQFSTVSVEPSASKLQELVDTGLTVAYRMRRDPLVSAVARLSLEQDVRAQFGTEAITQWIGASALLLEEAKKQGELLPHVVPSETAWLFSASWTGVQVYSQILAQREDLEARVVSLFGHLLPGIAVPAVLASLEITTARAMELGVRSEARGREALAGEPVAAG
ncbi:MULTISPECIES: ScbR family autoregulator-binding transcription factor [Streptomyces]|uniref:Gamma-butyrolactone receptor protein n=2 Tax=Streptomyces tsukubensis TaxID=83656 RepID=W0U0F5_9ACTN|nr:MULTISPECIES: ScbR family autoregulator-binding transcription factor [Streptomyces]AZK92496.1 TetR family transcriptional regulator [Streptomyces tsukubensis]EIF94512.1 regulatory protein TetR [Streptomyces tsukubensis NRRL18488]MYS65013.1 TetR family transcriptional regulator [Streptomyces sp. SID5473]QKM65872.1 TetR/AcrR family transcriptional regulator [Streptomyces tsukubensis NRRL18488]TAI40904.1 TetR/AcrR family transcriptional regulator [Streptomyces tsukubensis]